MIQLFGINDNMTPSEKLNALNAHKPQIALAADLSGIDWTEHQTALRLNLMIDMDINVEKLITKSANRISVNLDSICSEHARSTSYWTRVVFQGIAIQEELHGNDQSI